MYWVSSTLNENRGGTKKKSKASTLRRDDRIAGPRPHSVAVSITPSKYTMMRLLRWK